SRNPVFKRSPAASLPITPTTDPRAPSATRFASTFAAPPRCTDSRRTSTTGTGASGEIRVTSPQTNSSSITSPSTTTLRSRRRSRISEARALVNICALRFLCTDHKEHRSAQDSFNSRNNARHWHTQDTFRLSKFLAKIPVTGLARHLFENDFRGPTIPWTPVRDVGRTKDDDARRAGCG